MPAPTVPAESGAARPAALSQSSVVTAVSWIRRWGISIASFVSGVLTLFVFRRELPHIAWIVGYLMLLWLIFALLAQMRQALDSRRGRLVASAADYAVQTLYHGLLLFMLPAYYASTTLSSVNVVFLVVLAALTLLATFDPWYQALVHPRPWLGLAFFVVSIFAALNVALPLIGVLPHLALPLAAFGATVALTPAIRREGVSWWRAVGATCAVGALSAATAYAGRVAIPPAPISLARATMARGVAGVAPVDAFRGVISAQAVRESGGLIAYTAVYAPAGLRQPIAHVWRREGQVVSVVNLSPVHGGRRQGFRTYSRKVEFPAPATGAWTVDVITTSGQLIGRLRFRISTSEGA